MRQSSGAAPLLQCEKMGEVCAGYTLIQKFNGTTALAKRMAMTQASQLGEKENARPNIAGRRDVAGTLNGPLVSTAAPSRGCLLRETARGGTPARRGLRTPKPLRAQIPLEDNAANVDPDQTGHRKRVVISPSQWFSKVSGVAVGTLHAAHARTRASRLTMSVRAKTQNTPKATRCTIRDSPSHAMAIATLRNNNRVQVLRELHRRIIQGTSTQPADTAVQTACGRDTLQVESDGSRRLLTTPRPTPAKDLLDPSNNLPSSSQASAQSPSPPTPAPFRERVRMAEETSSEVAFGPCTASIEGGASAGMETEKADLQAAKDVEACSANALAQSSSCGWQVVCEQDENIPSEQGAVCDDPPDEFVEAASDGVGGLVADTAKMTAIETGLVSLSERACARASERPKHTLVPTHKHTDSDMDSDSHKYNCSVITMTDSIDVQ